MTPPEPGADDTIRILPSARRQRRSRTPLAVAAAMVALLIAGGVGWLFWPHPAPLPPPQPPAPVAAVPVPSPAFQLETATEQQILDHAATGLTVFRFAANPRILVLDFASLHEQGLMLDRVAALVEKAGLPRDRVLTDAELAEAIRASGDTIDTYYYGHDYSAAALAQFFALADQERIALNPEEQQLRTLLEQVGWFAPGASGGLISLPAVASDPKVTLAARAAILRHELSHGEFFSDPNYAAYVHDFWLTVLTEQERAGVRAFLAKEDYDADKEELMYNEMQAYLMFTRDPLFFTPSMAWLTPARLAELQARFLSGMPAGWLRDVLASYQNASAAR
jgi:hypothetical protein